MKLQQTELMNLNYMDVQQNKKRGKRSDAKIENKPKFSEETVNAEILAKATLRAIANGM